MLRISLVDSHKYEVTGKITEMTCTNWDSTKRAVQFAHILYYKEFYEASLTVDVMGIMHRLGQNDSTYSSL